MQVGSLPLFIYIFGGFAIKSNEIVNSMAHWCFKELYDWRLTKRHSSDVAFKESLYLIEEENI